jgi:phage shock protein C
MKRLCKSRTDIKIDGVCAGFAKYLSADITMVRIVFVILTLVTQIVPGVLVYIACSFVMPREDSIIDTRPDIYIDPEKSDRDN